MFFSLAIYNPYICIFSLLQQYLWDKQNISQHGISVWCYSDDFTIDVQGINESLCKRTL